jgi:hypothetical protein
MLMNDRTFNSVATGVDAQQASHSDHEAFFNHQRSLARDALNEIGAVLETLSARLDTAISGEEVDATPAVNHVRELIWSYNNAVECARDAWLHYDLSPSLNEQMLSIDTPTMYGLPWFLDEAQERRAMLQGVEISRRLRGRNELLDRIIAAADVVALSTHVAGVGLGGGSYLEIRRRDDRWTLVKTVANIAPPASKEKTRPCDARLAAALVRFMLRKQFNCTPTN